MTNSVMGNVPVANPIGANNSVMQVEVPPVRSGWRVIYILAILLALGALGLYAFSKFQSGIVQKKIEEKQVAIQALENDMSTAKNTSEYQKFVAAKAVHTVQTEQQGWGDRISRVLAIFEELRSLGGGNITFSDFSLDFEKLSLKGTVNDLRAMYLSGGIIDKFNSLDFLQDIAITDYKKTDAGYAFTLLADIVLDNASNK